MEESDKAPNSLCSDCLKKLEAGEVATLEIWLYDRTRKKGGGIDTLTCKLLQKTEEPAMECRVVSDEHQVPGVKRVPGLGTMRRSPHGADLLLIS